MQEDEMPVVSVFGAASDEVSQENKFDGWCVGKLVAKHGHQLSYGAGSEGVMGAVYDGYISSKPQHPVHGTTTWKIAETEKPHPDISAEYYDTLNSRTEAHYNSDAFVICFGGLGTLKELFDLLVMKRLGYINAPIYIIRNKLYAGVNELLRELYAGSAIPLCFTGYESVSIKELNERLYALHKKR